MRSVCAARSWRVCGASAVTWTGADLRPVRTSAVAVEVAALGRGVARLRICGAASEDLRSERRHRQRCGGRCKNLGVVKVG